VESVPRRGRHPEGTGNGMMNGLRVACGTIEGGALTKAANLHEFIESIENAILDPHILDAERNASHFPEKKRHNIFSLQFRTPALFLIILVAIFFGFSISIFYMQLPQFTLRVFIGICI